jgi:hypothetical protein
VSGVLGGDINVTKFNPDPEVTSNLLINNLAVLGDTLGDLSLQVHNASAKAIDANVALTGQGNNIKLSGLYYPQPVGGNNFNMELLLDPLNLASMEGLAQHQIKNSSGSLLGNLKLTGTMADPRLNGHLRTDQLSTNIAMLNSQFLMRSERIDFSGRNILFNNFGIRDSAGNLATLNGKIDAQELTNPRFDMRLRATDWRALNSTAKDNKLFYGQLFLTTNLEVTGSMKSPTVDGSLNVLKGTSVNVTIPENELTVQEREGIVQFVNMTDPNRYKVLNVKPVDTTKKFAMAPGGDMNLNIHLDEEAEFSVIVDEGTGDFLSVKGKADLNTTVAPDGTIGLVGTYEITSGAYQLNYNFIRRRFRIQPGSTIVFSGEPTDAEINITAIYEANIPPYDLVEKQVPDPAQLVFYKQRLPFEVHMKLNGPLMKPLITFDVILPEEKNYRVSADVVDLVQGKLNDLRNNPSDLNKQVFAVLILSRFVSDNPFESGSGGGIGLEYTARQSASRFISEQLNKLAGGLVKGLDLALDVESSEDFTTGQRRNRTDLNVAASKRLLNDRLTITVGNNFELEGPRGTNTGGSSLIPGNLALDYDLTSDSRYKVRAFRRNEDQGVIQGYVVETGLSFIVTVDYNRFKDIFISRRKRERQRDERRKQRLEKQKQDSLQTTQVTRK